MPYDPRMLQMAQMGVGMMGPQQGNPFANQQGAPQRPKQWWEQPIPRQVGRPPADQPDDPSKPKQPQPSLLQMLMLGGTPSYSGTPQGGGSPWGWLGSMGMPGGPGWGGGKG